ncbi:MAG: hypothetical protein V4441_07885 [Pseudomonadota bacterium]
MTEKPGVLRSKRLVTGKINKNFTMFDSIRDFLTILKRHLSCLERDADVILVRQLKRHGFCNRRVSAKDGAPDWVHNQ